MQYYFFRNGEHKLAFLKLITIWKCCLQDEQKKHDKANCFSGSANNKKSNSSTLKKL